MESSALITIGLPSALAIIMFGLGLTLTVGDFRRITQSPRAVVIALALQLLFLPAMAFGLIMLFDLDPLLAIGMMLLAASPGGTTANLYSHLFRGDVALNITLTAINAVLAAVTVPVITDFAIGYFGAEGEVGLQLSKVIQVIAIVLAPVVIGMITRHFFPALATRADRPVRIFSVGVLVLVSIGALIAERDNIADYARQVGLVTAIFCLCSLTLGYAAARLLRLARPPAIAVSMEVGIHNTAVAMTIALSVLNSSEAAIPAAVYSVLMYVIAALFGYAITRNSSATDGSDARPVTASNQHTL
ncbi:bile acid:sodium symporter family protein [Nocardia caishijiensis]|uniref:BASS family bile acid:Na+ symporter n=1 Tax=Nocardia caishijiensis TaxID=184756 RepID=A0ABQ6YHE5_9NOCA|nr:bile acid:sodium symporter family protein [Nocardia caishijiensis]KAF0845219.1 BASS family bile acid:Na+ symporter [Nocardia caishijiensis]